MYFFEIQLILIIIITAYNPFALTDSVRLSTMLPMPPLQDKCICVFSKFKCRELATETAKLMLGRCLLEYFDIRQSPFEHMGKLCTGKPYMVCMMHIDTYV